MDEKNLPEEQSKDQWLEEFLSSPDLAEEIGADDHAMTAAGLTHPSDLELEKIMQEVLGQSQTPEEMEREAALPIPDFDPTPMEPKVVKEPETFKDDEFRDTFGEGEVLDQVFSNAPMPPQEPPTEPETPPIAKEEPPVEKGRPKKKKGSGLLSLPHLAATAVWLLVILAIGVSIGHLGWICASDILAFGREPITATVTIEEGDDIDTIANKLQDAGLIEYTGLFKFYANITDAMEDIKPGTYQFTAVNDDNEVIVYDYMAIKSVLSPHDSGLVIVEDLRIPEGYTCAQIFRLLEEKKVCTVKELEEYAANGELDAYWFLEGVQRGDKYCLEGYLFPDTYDFYENDDPKRVLEKLLDGFDAAFTDLMRKDLEVLNDRLEEMMRDNGYGSDYINSHKYSIREVVIIASMIEKETATNLESFTISSVIYNRLTNANKYPYLNIDATLVYALGGKADLTEEDKKLDSPYNTYLYPGLTPGPISNPSQNSIAAALDPEDTDFYFYALDPELGEHRFFKTYQEHLDFLASLEDAQ